MRRALTLIVPLSALLLSASTALAWGTKEHVQLTRMAVMRLLEADDTPDAMKRWLREVQPGLLDAEQEREYFLRHRMGVWPRGVDGLAYWSVVPDLAAMAEKRELPEYKAPEQKLHFVDIEFFHPDPEKRRYLHDLSARPALEDFPRELNDPRWKDAGMLPFRVQECYRELVRTLKAGRLADRPGQFPRDDHAVRHAGYLAHYVADNTQPHHATIDYKSLSYLGRAGLRAPNIHSALEWQLGDDEGDDFAELRAAYWAALTEELPRARDPYGQLDAWTSTLRVALDAYTALPLVGTAAQAAVKGQDLDLKAFYLFEGKWNGEATSVLRMKARQQALAVARIASMWRKAWDQAHAPAAAP